MQVWPVENPPEDAIEAGVVGIKQSLIGHSICHEPHAKEEEEEEDVLHLYSKIVVWGFEFKHVSLHR